MIFNTRDLVKSDSSHFSNNFKRLVLREQDYFTSSINVFYFAYSSWSILKVEEKKRLSNKQNWESAACIPAFQEIVKEILQKGGKYCVRNSDIQKDRKAH